MAEWIQLIVASRRQPKEQFAKSTSQITHKQSLGVIQKEFKTVHKNSKCKIMRADLGETTERLSEACLTQDEFVGLRALHAASIV